MKTNRIFSVAACAMMLFLGAKSSAQVDFEPKLNTLRMEVRADFDYFHNLDGEGMDPYGFHGKYFNLHMGGNIGEKFSYYFRQRLQAQEGSIAFFDNTDFLYINYTPNKNWMFRLGKDALAVGGWEYDAAPIDVLFSTHYWDNFYCFQLAMSAAYKSDDGNHMLIAQLGTSPYAHFVADAPINDRDTMWKSGLMSYNFYWSGKFDHLKLLYSVNFFERERGHFMNYIALGNKLAYDKFDIYLDLIHHAITAEDWGKNFAVIGCFNWYATKDLSFYGKVGYEQNLSDYVALGLTDLVGQYSYNPDCFIESQHSYLRYGVGFEYRPAFCKAVRVHGVASLRNKTDHRWDNSLAEVYAAPENIFNFNMGITWDMDCLKLINR